LEGIDLNNLTLTQVFGTLAIIALADIASAIALSVVHGDFSPGKTAIWLQSHVLRRTFPIFSLAVIGHGIVPLDIPAIGPAFIAALAGLTAYVIETLASIQNSFKDTTPPTDTTPVT
jgi:hypothetical protein